MADYLVTDTQLTNIANSIRTKAQKSSQLIFPDDFMNAISLIRNPYDLGLTERSDTISQTLVAETVPPNGYYHVQWSFPLSYFPAVGNCFFSSTTIANGFMLTQTTYSKNGNAVTLNETYRNVTANSIKVYGTRNKTITYYTE